MRPPVVCKRGTVVLVEPPPTSIGHEQDGRRPCVVVSDSTITSELRFPMLAVVPLTKTPLPQTFYPVVQPRPASGLRAVSTALPDHTRSIDPERVIKVYGAIAATELDAIDAALSRFLGLK
jgi:mRNA interferase MazF